MCHIHYGGLYVECIVLSQNLFTSEAYKATQTRHIGVHMQHLDVAAVGLIHGTLKSAALAHAIQRCHVAFTMVSHDVGCKVTTLAIHEVACQHLPNFRT